MNYQEKTKKDNLIKDLVETLAKENKMPVIYIDLLKDDATTGILILNNLKYDNMETDFVNSVLYEKAEELTGKIMDLLYDEDGNLLDHFNSYWVEFLNSNNKNTLFGNQFLLAQKKKTEIEEGKEIEYILVLINSTQIIDENTNSNELKDQLTDLISKASDKINLLTKIAEEKGISKEQLTNDCLSTLNSLREYFITNDSSILDNDMKLNAIINNKEFRDIINSLPIKELLTGDKFDDIVNNLKENGFTFMNNINKGDFTNGK